MKNKISNKTSFGIVFLFLSTVLGLCFFVGAKAKAETSIIISQVQITGGAGKTGNDFVELYNNSDAAINLKGYRLVKRTANGSVDTSLKSWTADACVPPKGYYLWANSDFTSISPAADITTSGTVSADNGVALRKGDENTGAIIDAISWGTTSNSFTNISVKNPEANQALLRGSDGSFSIVQSSPRNSSQTPVGWVCPVSQTASSSSSGTGGGVVTKSSQIFITEILANPNGEDPGQEQVELRNDSLETVNLDGWYLADKSVGAAKEGAYKFPPQLFLRQSYVFLTMPKGLFSLNNTGGETVNLFNSEKSLMDSVAYEDEAPEGLSYQKIGGVWIWSQPTLGAENYAAEYGLATGTPVFIAEFMPNPEGGNEGRQWVKIKNYGSLPFNLKGFILDSVGQEARPSPIAWVLDDKAVVPAKSFVALTIPEDKFTLSNLGHEALRFFDGKAKLLEQINFSQAPEGKSYQKNNNGDWVYGEPIKEPAQAAAALKLAISEILPNPENGQGEFLEIQNLGDGDLLLKGLVVKVGDSKRTISKEVKVEPQGFYVFYEADLPAKLRNSGQTVSISSAGSELAKVEYDPAEAGQSYARSTEGQYFWTSEPTPGQENKLVLGAATGNAELGSQKNSGKAEKKSANKSNEGALEKKMGALEDKIGELTLALADKNPASQIVAQEIPPATGPPASPPGNKIVYLVVVLIGIALLVFLVKWNL